ncbi:hypothetical protein BBO_00166 [Beauveria brongniartii RCEF 3172]|uniref:Uncharacterized protein n=1 Tax=Beauveria brongniartii RCEF 3172 TaxID=1081107 RepID=A0A162I4U1_9HYPO|nr:hypothetical protein BBO_00166 [Beauveria brongniartii RCEF 3172]
MDTDREGVNVPADADAKMEGTDETVSTQVASAEIADTEMGGSVIPATEGTDLMTSPSYSHGRQFPSSSGKKTTPVKIKDELW